MAARREGWFDQKGLNLIRIVIGSYFCAIALGLPAGFDPFVIPSLVLPSELATSVGSILLLFFAVIFVAGVMLRTMTLVLAGYMILSSVLSHVLVGASALGDVWQSIAFGVAVLLCYGSLRPYEMHKAALFPALMLRGGATRMLQKSVVPKRVRPARRRGADDEGASVRSLRPLIAPTDRMIGLSDARADLIQESRSPTPKARLGMVDDEDVENIFANL